MTVLDGQAAIARMAGFKTYPAGKCLQAVDQSFQKPQSDRPGYYTYALRAANATPAGNRHDRSGIRAGMVVYLSAGANGYGHICIATDNVGGVISTDVPTGHIGRTTIDALCKAWGRQFLFAADWLMGYSIGNLGPAAGGGSSSGGSSAFSQAILQEQAFVNSARGEKLAVDGIAGPATIAAFKRYQTFLKQYGYTGAIDGLWGQGTQDAHARYYAVWSAPKQTITDVVKNQQTQLNKWGAMTPPLAVDGIPGPKFKQATVIFQKAHGMTPDGIIGPATWALLGTNP